MTKIEYFKDKLRSILSDGAPDELLESYMLELFHFQYEENLLYRSYVDLLKTDLQAITHSAQIPFLPISFFKTHLIQSGTWQPEKVFESSGTSGMQSSRHLVEDLSWYDFVAKHGFESVYGPADQLAIFALLPGYLERGNSSLIHMVQMLMDIRKDRTGGFFLHDFSRLSQAMAEALATDKRVLLIGVTYALLDFAEYVKRLGIDWSSVIIMETGGMKGKRKEMIRKEVHERLKDSFQVDNIHSEYGMTELLSQGYSCKEGVFYPIPSLRVLPGRITDPLSMENFALNAQLKAIDLANIASCSFIATEDIGRVYEDGSFEVLGRFDHSDIRGCNLLYGA